MYAKLSGQNLYSVPQLLPQTDTFQTDIDGLIQNNARFAPREAINDKGAGGDKPRCPGQ